MIDDSSFARVEEFRYLETTLTNQNSVQEEIKSKSKSENSFGVESLVFQFVIKKFEG